MMELAAAVQGISKSELSDPVVNLLIESLAEEIYCLSTEIDNLEARVLNKLSSMLVSETKTVASPTHSLLHVQPLEPKLELATTHSFALGGQNRGLDDLQLYPVCNTPVYNGGIRYFIFERYLYSMDRELTKTLITRSGPTNKEPFEAHAFWIGLELDDSIKNVENLSFYINLPGGYHSTDNLKQLMLGKWECCGHEIRMHNDIFHIEETLGHPILDLFRKSDNAYKVNRETREHYGKHFMTIDQPFNIEGKKEIFPASLQSGFPDEIMASFNKTLLWFKITCPPSFTEEMVRAIEVSINIVPVSCKQLVKEVLQVNKHIPIIPLHTKVNESFLAVHSLSNSDGVHYYDIPLDDTEHELYGVYALRSSGLERFGRDDAKEFLANITNLIDQEKASFFKKESDTKEDYSALQEDISTMVRNLAQIVHSEKGHTEVKNYLLVDQQRETEIYFLAYWTANSLAGETIKEDTPVRATPGLPVAPAGVHLIRPLSGGKRTPSQYEKYNLFKRSLSEHPLLVTPGDICSFCLKEFGEIVEQARVGTGYKKTNAPSDGFVKTTDVYLHLRQYQRDKVDKNMHQYIEQILQEYSPSTYNYRVILQ